MISCEVRQSHPARKRAHTIRWKNGPRCEIARQSQAPTPAQGRAGKNLLDSEDPEYRQIPFSVTGRIDNPKTDLFDKLIGAKGSGRGRHSREYPAFECAVKIRGGVKTI
jgi:hypothetical protein